MVTSCDQLYIERDFILNSRQVEFTVSEPTRVCKFAGKILGAFTALDTMAVSTIVLFKPLECRIFILWNSYCSVIHM